MEKILTIKDWLNVYNNQFKFIGTNNVTVRRLNDGMIFGLYHRVSIGNSMYYITGFNKNCIDVYITDFESMKLNMANINDLYWVGLRGW